MLPQMMKQTIFLGSTNTLIIALCDLGHNRPKNLSLELFTLRSINLTDIHVRADISFYRGPLYPHLQAKPSIYS